LVSASDPNSLPYGVNPEQVATLQAQSANTGSLSQIPQQSQIAPQLPGEQPRNPNQDIYGTQAMEKAYGQGVEEQKAGITQQMQAEQQLGQLQADTLKAQIAQQQKQAALYENHYNQLNNERKAFVDDIKNTHIDPNNI